MSAQGSPPKSSARIENAKAHNFLGPGALNDALVAYTFEPFMTVVRLPGLSQTEPTR